MSISFFKTSYNSVGHFIARQFGTLKRVNSFVGAHSDQIEKGLDKVAKVAETGAILAGHPELAILIEASDKAGQALLGKAFEVVSKLDKAADAKGTNLPLDAAAIAALREFFAKAESVVPGITAAPAGLPLETAVAI